MTATTSSTSYDLFGDRFNRNNGFRRFGNQGWKVWSRPVLLMESRNSFKIRTEMIMHQPQQTCCVWATGKTLIEIEYAPARSLPDKASVQKIRCFLGCQPQRNTARTNLCDTMRAWHHHYHSHNHNHNSNKKKKKKHNRNDNHSPKTKNHNCNPNHNHDRSHSNYISKICPNTLNLPTALAQLFTLSCNQIKPYKGERQFDWWRLHSARLAKCHPERLSAELPLQSSSLYSLPAPRISTLPGSNPLCRCCWRPNPRTPTLRPNRSYRRESLR